MTNATRVAAEVAWNKIACPRRELELGITLACGQSFRWRELKPGYWTSVLAGHVWTLTQNNDILLYRVHAADKHNPVMTNGKEEEMYTTKTKQDCNKETNIKPHPEESLLQESKDTSYFEQILRDYFQLDVNLSDLYARWSKVDPNFKAKGQLYPGVRILRQEPVENLFSFICFSNNNISRISLMVERMCETYGELVTEVDGISYYSFPTVDALAGNGVEETLRCLGFGYRAKYITETARYIMQHHSTEWLYSLRALPYDEARNELMKLSGVGAKGLIQPTFVRLSLRLLLRTGQSTSSAVEDLANFSMVADCVCLMSLDKHNAVPVDTHVWQIVNRDYKQAHLSNTKTMTNTVYKQIGDFFRELWGDYAGWAQSVLFSADLNKFPSDNKATSEQLDNKKHTCTGNGKTKVKRKRKQ